MGLLCRILGLYASRGIEVQHVQYAHAAQNVMRLDIRAVDALPDTQETIRVLVAKAANFVGVIAVADKASGPGLVA